MPENYEKLLEQQDAPDKRQLDCYYVPPAKRQRLDTPEDDKR